MANPQQTALTVEIPADELPRVAAALEARDLERADGTSEEEYVSAFLLTTLREVVQSHEREQRLLAAQQADVEISW